MQMSEINLHNTMDAQVWTKEFMRLFGGKLETIDEALMLGWFANAIMAGYDTAMQRQPDLTDIQNVYERYNHLDTILSDTKFLGDIQSHILYELWHVVRELCKEAP